MDFSQEGRSSSRVAAKKGSFNKYYTVKKGDTLDSLSKRFNVSSKLLAAWNNLKHKIALKAGSRIIIAKFTEKNGEMVPVGNKS